MIDVSGLVLWMTESHYYFEIGEVNIGEVVHLFFRYVYDTTHSTINHKIEDIYIGSICGDGTAMERLNRGDNTSCL